MYYPDLTGALFKARSKERDASPDYFGRVQVAGRTYKLAGWIREPKGGGEKYINLRLTLDSEDAR